MVLYQIIFWIEWRLNRERFRIGFSTQPPNLTEEKQLLNMAYNTVRKRIADALIELHDKYKKENEKSFSISIPRNDLASMVGTSTETVTRTLSEFKEDGFLNIKGSEVTVMNYEGLKKIKW